MLGKRAAWRRAANQLWWMLTEPRVLRVRLAGMRAYVQAHFADQSLFTFLDETQFKNTRKSERVFIFGSGWSLNEITPAGWAHIATHDTFGFSMFVYQQWVRTDYHLLREMYVTQELEKDFWLPYSQEFAHFFDTNPHFDQTILLAQSGWRAITVNRMFALGLLKKPRRVLRFKVVEGYADTEPNFSLAQGIVHGAGSLIDAINLAVVGGWRDLVLTGVDLYDGRYFWEDQFANVETFGRDSSQKHNTVQLGIIDNIAHWRDVLAARGVRLWVYNPKSLLTAVLPVYEWDETS